MKPIAIFQHAEGEGANYFGEFLDRNKVPFDVIRIDKDDEMPDNVAHFSGLCFMGGPMSVNDPLPWITGGIELIRAAHELGKPVIGHCLGGQMISKALGGSVSSNSVTELGWHDVHTVESLVLSDWIGGLDEAVGVLHWHSETFSIPFGATPLLRSEFCHNQAFLYHKNLALQFHLEVTREMLEFLINKYTDDLCVSTPTQQNKEQIMSNVESRLEMSQRFADRLYGAWIELL
jgi:GMP synthase-like glutamine amidotransferase